MIAYFLETNPKAWMITAVISVKCTNVELIFRFNSVILSRRYLWPCWGAQLRPFDRLTRSCRFESHCGRGCSSLLLYVWCMWVAASVTICSLVQKSPIGCVCVCVCVCVVWKPQPWGGRSPIWFIAPQKRKSPFFPHHTHTHTHTHTSTHTHTTTRSWVVSYLFFKKGKRLATLRILLHSWSNSNKKCDQLRV
jgi:hypothetical protein